MRNELFTSCAFLWLVGTGCPAGAQSANAVVVPSAYANRDAPGTAFWALSPFAARRQLVVDAAHLSAATGLALRALGLRRNTGDDAPLDGGLLDVELWLSHTAAQPNAPGVTFAANRGADHRQLFAGTLSLPDTPPAGVQPAGWSYPYGIELPFRAPFFYRGGNLCIETFTDLARDPVTGGVDAPWWTIDAVVQDVGGTAESFGFSCVPGRSDASAGAEPRSLVIGSNAAFYFRGRRSAASAYCLLGIERWRLANGTPLPLDLTAFGAPGCSLQLDPLVVAARTLAPLARGGIVHAQYDVPIPFDLNLAGINLFSQWMLLDPGANQLGATFSNGVRVIVGGHSSPLGVGWVEATTTTALQGRVLPGRSPVIRLVH